MKPSRRTGSGPSYWLPGVSLTKPIAKPAGWQETAPSLPSGGGFSENDVKNVGNAPRRLRRPRDGHTTHLLTSSTVARRQTRHTPTLTQLPQVRTLPHLVCGLIDRVCAGRGPTLRRGRSQHGRTKRRPDVAPQKKNIQKL